MNVFVRSGYLRPRPGLAGLSTVTSDPQTLVTFKDANGTAQHVVGGRSGIYRWNGAAYVILTTGTLTGGTQSRPIFRVFDEAGVKWLLATNGVDVMKKWDPAAGTTLVNAGGSPPLAKHMVVSGDHVVLFNLRSGGVISGAGWDVSTALDPDSGWGGGVQRGILQGTNGEIVAALEMGNLSNAVYTEDGIHMMFFQGGAEPFRFELKASEIVGAANANAVIRLPNGGHAYLSRSFNVYGFDGVFPTPLFGQKVQRYLRDTAQDNPSKLDFSFLLYDERRDLLWIFFADSTVSYCNRAVAVDMSTGAMWPMLFSHNNADSLACGYWTGPNGKPVLGAANNDWVSEINADDGAITDVVSASGDVVVYWETGLFDGGLPAEWKTIAHVENFFESVLNMSIQLGYSHFGEGRNLTALQTVPAATPRRNGFGQEGRFFSVRMSHSNPSVSFRWMGGLVFAEQRGRK